MISCLALRPRREGGVHPISVVFGHCWGNRNSPLPSFILRWRALKTESNCQGPGRPPGRAFTPRCPPSITEEGHAGGLLAPLITDFSSSMLAPDLAARCGDRRFRAHDARGTKQLHSLQAVSVAVDGHQAPAVLCKQA